ncbi:thioesterase family protein [Altererythrobacter sp. MF3-039]|uniref:thioesterase family protein n=1 Tax=Altererythrobacter sp. MF3-039 TaxID=3252901 RepID=UPI00390CD147
MNPSELIEPIRAQDGAVHLAKAEDWMQGRTLYGGASALIAYTHAARSFPDLPPLRAAQIGFVAPVGGNLDLRSTIVRQGRNVTQVRSELYQDEKLALTAFFLFGADREANARYEGEAPASLPAPPAEAEAVPGPDIKHFINNFELRRAQVRRGPGKPVVRRWVRLRERGELDPVSELVLMGDILPPGAMRAMERRGPISSINWSFNVLDTNPSSDDGWWLAENSSEMAAAGYSSERLQLRDAQGRLILSGLQAVAIFG